MIRSPRRYDVAVRERTIYEVLDFGTVSRFLYTDHEGQDWVRVDGEWQPVEDRYNDPHVYVHQRPNEGRCTDVQESLWYNAAMTNVIVRGAAQIIETEAGST